MCGIAGVIGVGRALTSAERAAVPTMVGALTHRGPDDEGFVHGQRLSAGMRRLSIIDVAGGAQPAQDARGEVRVLFNGEVYNHGALRDGLAKEGVAFATRSDTEVLAQLFARDGLAMFRRLRGMYALCVEDDVEESVVLARDPAGIKPLWIAEAEGRIAFASEVAALARAGFARALDPVALVELATTQLVSANGSAYEGVRALRPGFALVVRGGEVSELEIASASAPRARAEVDELRSLLERAVEQRMISEVPLGVFLSGGIDSAAILACASRHAPEGLDAFTVGFQDADDEVEDAASTAMALGARHHALYVSARQMADEHRSLTAHVAGPIVDPAILPTRLLASFARERVTVVLTGEGADELFGGYRRHLIARMPHVDLGELPEWASRLGGGRARQAVEALRESDPAARYLDLARVMSRQVAETLFERELLDEAASRARADVAPHFAHKRGVAADLAADRARWLPSNLLAKVDLATMASSLEARVPFLDAEVVSAAISMESSALGKLQLRQALIGLVPPDVLLRKKRGFALPLDAWLRGPWAGELEAALPALDAWPGLIPGRARAVVDEHRAGAPGLGLVVFLLWSFARFFEARA